MSVVGTTVRAQRRHARWLSSADSGCSQDRDRVALSRKVVTDSATLTSGMPAQTQDAESSLVLTSQQERHDPGQHKLSSPEGLAMIESREGKEHCTRNPLACRSCVPEYVICIASVEAARHRHLRQQFVESGPVL